MNHAADRLAGHFPLAPGKSVSLEPRACGKLRVGAGTLALDGRLLQPGEQLTLWRGDSVQLANAQRSGTAHFAWDVCEEQPSLFERLRRSLAPRSR